MRNILLSLIVYVLATSCFGKSMTWISYAAQDFGGGRWEYTYEAANVDLFDDGVPEAIKEFTIWFDPDLYANLAVTTTIPLSNAWNEIVWQPEPVLLDAGGYDALAEIVNPGIAAGQSVRGFSVAFDWLGQGSPGSQYYEIIDPLTFEIIDAGHTIPEPMTLLLFGLSGLFMQKRRDSK